MPCAFTGGPYYETLFLAADQTIMIETLADALTHCGWKTIDKVSAWAEGAAVLASDGTVVTIDGDSYTFKTSPIGTHQVAVGSTAADSATNLAAKVNANHATVSMNYDNATGKIRASYRTGGSFGNGTHISGWILWASDPAYGAENNQMWLGGYKMQTNFPGRSGVLPAIPCICYVYSADTFNWAWVTDGSGWPTSSPEIQFMSADQSIKGAHHLITPGPGARMKFIGSPTQFFLFRLDVIVDPAGACVCGGSFYTNYDANDPPSDAWWSMGDAYNNPFDAAGTPRAGYGSQMASLTGRMSESCFDGAYKGPPSVDVNVTQLSLRMNPDNPGQFHGALQPHRRYGGDPIVSEPFLLGNGLYLGQFYDSLTVGKDFVTGFTGNSLASAYPWTDGSTLPDGTPKNRLSGDFDQAKWENITESFVYGSLFVVSGIPSFMKGKFNYVYEGKA